MNVVGAKFVGTRILLTGRFTAGGSSVAVDPFNVAVKARHPDGTFTSHVYGTSVEIMRTGVGVYEFRFVLDMRGRWWFGFEGYGSGSPVLVAEEVSVIAKRRSSIAA